MIKSVSDEIGVTVISSYQKEHSDPVHGSYIHAYQITISNNSHIAVQLKSREWHIMEASGKETIVKGNGVVGQTPVIYPGEQFIYVSCCPLESPIGSMDGHYRFMRLDNEKEFLTSIPRFHLVCPNILN